LTSIYADRDERLKHGTPKSKEAWTEADEWKDEEDGHVDLEVWEYLDDVWDAAFSDKFHGGANLKILLCNDEELP
jgi:hypothetical protein